MLSAAQDQANLSGEPSRERRRGVRLRQNRPIKVYDPAATRYLAGRTHDVSRTGLRIELPLWAPLQPGRMLLLHVSTEPSDHPLIRRHEMVSAEVVWVDRLSSVRRGQLIAGIELVARNALHLDAA